MRAFTEVIAFLFVPSTFTFSLFHCPFSLHISCFFLFRAFYVFIAPFFIISFSHHFIVSFLTFTFLITPPFLSSCVPFSDFKQCQASVVWVNREVSVSPSVRWWNVTQEQALSHQWEWNGLSISVISDGLAFVLRKGDSCVRMEELSHWHACLKFYSHCRYLFYMYVFRASSPQPTSASHFTAS